MIRTVLGSSRRRKPWWNRQSRAECPGFIDSDKTIPFYRYGLFIRFCGEKQNSPLKIAPSTVKRNANSRRKTEVFARRGKPKRRGQEPSRAKQKNGAGRNPSRAKQKTARAGTPQGRDRIFIGRAEFPVINKTNPKTEPGIRLRVRQIEKSAIKKND